MKNTKRNVIIRVENNSIARESGIERGDILTEINGKNVIDVFDYRYLINDEYIELGIKKANGEEWIIEIEKEFDEDLGIIFESGLMDDAKSCRNKCMFCFIDQMPKGMRETLYFKDDDSRLSFLQGNYVTLTNMNQKDIDRILYYHLSPINISVHTTDLELRKNMLKNPLAEKLFEYIEQFSKANIEMNCQVVLCKGLNDGQQLEKTIKDLSIYIPQIKSLSVVPVGLTKYRQKLYPLELFKKEDAINVINIIHSWQYNLKQKYDNNFVFASDEFYLKAELPMPNIKSYEDFPQIENGVGMMVIMEHELKQALNKVKGDSIIRHISIATGEAAYCYICKLCDMIKCKFINTSIDIYNIKNNFFGENITVAGLLTGQDLLEQLSYKELGNCLLISQSTLRTEDTVFLDNMDIKELEYKLNVPIKAVENTGIVFLESIINLEDIANGKTNSGNSRKTECR